jgi:hypothetical protein
MLVELFERVENFLRRLECYTEVPPTEAMTDIIVKVMVEVLSILTIATTEIKQSRISKLIPRRMSQLTYLFSTIWKEATRLEGYRRCACEAGQSYSRGSSDGYGGKLQGHTERGGQGRAGD